MKTQYIQPEIAIVTATTLTLLAGSDKGLHHGNAKDLTLDEDSWDFDESDDDGWPTEEMEW
ncbi:MAG: hypothetical protein ACOCN0_07750 [Prevotella sp.]